MTVLVQTAQLVVGHHSPLLRDVDLAFGAGEGWFVLGRNGSGKTTLVHTLIGLQQPLGGTITLAPELADHRRIGYVPQEARFELALPCTVAEFTALGLPDREPRGTAQAAVRSALAALGIAALATMQVARLSGGQRRRTLIARALARQPRLLVLDEPTAGLDAPTAQRLAADLDALRAAHGLCVVHVSHDLAIAARHATHIALVHDGRVLADSAAALRGDARLAAAVGFDLANGAAP